ncbi:MAG: TonB C-terminal domain-containing protein, partial [Myxococcota bacterium]
MAQVMVAEAETFRRREFRRLITISLIFHGVAFLIFIWDPLPRRPPALPSVVAVQFVALPADAGKIAPPAPSKPKPPAAKKVVLPAKPKPLKPKPKPKPKPVAKKPEPKKPEPKPEVKPEPKPEARYEDVMAELRAEGGVTAVKPRARTSAPVAEALPGGAVGTPLSAAEAAWQSRVRIHLKKTWVLAPGFRLEPLSTLVRVRLDASGHVVGEPRVERSSGNPWYD